jgi:hypothetical protein
MSEKYRIKESKIVDLDYETKLVFVVFLETKPGWFWNRVTERCAVFTYIGLGEWLDNVGSAVLDTELRLKLHQLLVAQLKDPVLDRYIAIP